MKNLRPSLLLATSALLVTGASCAQAQPWQLRVQADKPGVTISPVLYGLMTEEINYSYDGGLYAELIRNRVFQDNPTTPVHWSLVQTGGATGAMALDRTAPLNPKLSTSLKLTVAGAANGGRVGVSNEGYFGVPVEANTTYKVSFYAKAADGFQGPLSVGIESPDGTTTFARTQIKNVGTGWKKYETTLKTGAIKPSTDNRFVISAQTAGSVYLNLVSLFPPTYKNRPNGNRIDLMQKLGAMNPSFLRFPGGNYLDPGGYKWKEVSIGPLEQRAGHPGAWSYRSSDGLGLLEFMGWCEDLNMEPVLGVSVGRGVLANDGDITPYVQDALDQVEYLTGPATSKWGARRVADGHAAPFKLRFIEIGNEDFFDPLPVYNARFARFYDVIRARYPQLQIIATRGDVSSRRPDIIDEHYYNTSAQMQRMATLYDTYDRKGPKIFVGEWASQDIPEPWKDVNSKGPTPSLNSALGDAAFMIGMERNSDLVIMHCYAPLLVNVNPGGRQWAVNLIGYDGLRSFGSPAYYAQTMFSNNRGDVVLPVNLSSIGAPAPQSKGRGAVGVGTWATQAEYKDLKVTTGNDTLYQWNPVQGSPLYTAKGGKWNVTADGLAQSSDETDSIATIGNPNWTDYTYTVKARKTGGNEGFLIVFRSQDGQNNVWWNVGGWNNTRSAVQVSVDGNRTEVPGSSKPMRIETGRWYDIKVEVKGDTAKTYLDGQLINDVKLVAPKPVGPLFATASRETKTGDIILKVVNTSATSQSVQLDMQGVARLASTAKAEVMSGPLDAVNTLAEPTHIAPKTVTVKGVSKNFAHQFPAHSVNVIRFKTR